MNRLSLSQIVLSLLFPILLARCTGRHEVQVPDSLKGFISDIAIDSLGNHRAEVTFEELEPGLAHISIVFDLTDSLRQDDWQVRITPAFDPDFHWSPHLTPTDNHIVAQHVFRSPALIVRSADRNLTVIPDLDRLAAGNPVEWYMDLDALSNMLTLGMGRYDVKEHVLFVRKNGAVYPPGKLEFGFYVLASSGQESVSNPFKDASEFIWEKWGAPLYSASKLDPGVLEKYVGHTYNWAFGSWREPVFQEFEMDGRKVGAPAFIVNTTQSPNFPGEINEREFRSVWNQAWFNSLRSASGLYRYAIRTNNSELKKYALMTKELALAFPQNRGFFQGLVATEMQQVEIDGAKYNRSKGWNTYYFGNSNRNPVTWDAAQSPYHILDMSFTAWQMLQWYALLEKDERLLAYASEYGKALVDIQDERGFFPAWLDTETLKPIGVLDDSPESSMSVTFLLKLFELAGEEAFRNSALRAMDAIVGEIIDSGRWEDFETYWSCSRYGADTLVGRKVIRNNQFKQNTFSMYWTAEALLNCYETTGESHYLDQGIRVLDELLMYQAAWQPPYIYVRALGGFGVMNADGEWNDARQSLFAGLILRYARLLDREDYFQRGLAALFASFEMMYCPENESTRKQWEKAWPFFNEKDYGFMMENYGHGGFTGPEGIGIGEFTIYDWGNGAAAEAYNRIRDEVGTDLFHNRLP